MASIATSPAFSISEGMSSSLVTAWKRRASGVLGMTVRFLIPPRSIPSLGRKPAVLTPSTKSKGISGRSAERTSAIRAKT